MAGLTSALPRSKLMKVSASRFWSLVLSALAFIAFVILAEAVERGATGGLDTMVRAIVHESAAPYLTSFATMVSFLGRLLVLIPATAVIGGWLLKAGWRSSALALGLAMGGALVLNWLIKTSIHRIRPQPFFGVDPESFSFPSGHVFFSSCFCGTMFLILKRRRKISPLVLVLGSALVLAIAWSRVYLGVHYPTDVVAGFLIAVSWLATLFSFGLFNRENGVANP